MTDHILLMSNISKSFAGVHALRGVSFDLYPGEVHALLGENGAGKSTLIKIITGVHQPDSGEITLNGQQIHLANPLESRQLGIAAIYQEPSLFPDLDIAENIFVGRQPTRAGGQVAWSDMYREASKLLDSLGVHLEPRTKARHLSVAQQQMVEIARALSVQAKILIMDEPTSSLTLAEVDDLFRIVRQLRQAGTAIVFISHRLEELFELADRVTVLRDGAYVDTKLISAVTTDSLIQMMVGRQLADLFPKLAVEAGEVVLQVEGLSRDGAFQDVSFELHRGEILGMAGLVGAGRTDVARAIFGVDAISGGTIKINGQPVTITGPQKAMQLGLAYVPEDRQHHGLILPMRISYNITLPILSEFAKQGWLDTDQEQQSAAASATQMEVKAAGLWQRVRELSGGNQQKVVLAKWLATKPRILILDEPTRGIDVGTKAAVHGLMSELAAQGMAILMISSELPEILGMSDRILVMREGRLTGHFSRAEATQEKIMLAATQAVEQV
ncbi:MAG: sugar ABC transporter ATP-binding protein [Anaerolineaceae bacterium]|nr:sugar ABC transporter ATP-binding protein [Anaerolineaceae bacterium]MCB9101863.1 sugar ABC transporter ATP-binding protein [Anaerolineales bacterium]